MTFTPPRVATAREHFSRDVVSVLGLPFDVLDVDGAVRALRDAAFAKRRCFLSTPNVNFAVMALNDTAFRRTVLRSDLSLVDGTPIVRLGRTLGAPLTERVAGATVFEALRRHPGPALDVFLFGGQPGIAERACRVLNDSGGGLRCVGFHDPGFGTAESFSDPATVDRINASRAHFVVAALGARKGQAWLERVAPRLEAPILGHLGAVINFAATAMRRAPVWMQSVGLEWLWRIREEPALWRRYASDAGSLTAALVGRVLPTLRRRRAAWPEPSLTFEVLDDVVTLRLSGGWRRGGLELLRRALCDAEDASMTLRLDLSEVVAVDAAFVGLLQIALGRFGSQRIAWFAATPDVARTFRQCLVEPCAS